MFHNKALSVNQALWAGLRHMSYFAAQSDTRNGPVWVSPMPVLTTYVHPRNRVLISPHRKANPFFHLFESLWMLAGRNDLALPKKLIANFSKYSDDGETLHGAYGYRWRAHFGEDQLKFLVHSLKDDPSSRRNVLTMWDARVDRRKAVDGGRDVPCNTQAYFDTIDGKLNMTVTCRSNDVIYGAHGANAVHFSILLEWLSATTEIPMGVYRQFSNNYHVYSNLYPQLVSDKRSMEQLGDSVRQSDIYTRANGRGPEVREVYPINMVPLIREDENAHGFLDACAEFCDDFVADRELPVGPYQFMQGVVEPMATAWRAAKAKDYTEAKRIARGIVADDWRNGALEWIGNKEKLNA